MKQKRITRFGQIAGVLALVALLGFAVTGCSKKDDTADKKTLKVGATAVPHAEILAQVKDDLAAKGVDLEVIEYSDYVTPNTALNDGELDANFFQHKPYLDEFNEKNGTKIVSVGTTHFEPLGVYAGKSASLASVPEKAKIAIPNDATNEARALLLLQEQKLITLKDDAGITATPNDIVSNPKNIEFVEVDAANVPRLLEDSDFAVINGNFALSAGLDPANALVSENAESLAAQTYANIVAVQEGKENEESIKELIDALHSDKIKDFIVEKYQGTVVPVF